MSGECIPPEHGCILADQAADRAVKKTFAILGVDINKPESVMAFQEDLRFNRHMRRRVDKGVTAVWIAAMVGTATIVWLSITGAFTK